MILPVALACHHTLPWFLVCFFEANFHCVGLLKPLLPIADITSGPPQLSIDEDYPYTDDEVTFKCDTNNVMANPEVSTVRWFKDNTALTNWSDTSLTITRKVSLEDSGGYKCIVQNAAGYSGFSHVVELNVSSSVSKYHNSVKHSITCRSDFFLITMQTHVKFFHSLSLIYIREAER